MAELTVQEKLRMIAGGIEHAIGDKTGAQPVKVDAMWLLGVANYLRDAAAKAVQA